MIALVLTGLVSLAIGIGIGIRITTDRFMEED